MRHSSHNSSLHVLNHDFHFAVDNSGTLPESGEAKISKVKERIKWQNSGGA
jgi:hypothetical protein